MSWRDSYGGYQLDFGSVEQLLRYIEEHERHPQSLDHSDIFGDVRWYGTDSLASACSLLRKGWPEGLKRIKSKVEIIQQHISYREPEKEIAYGLVGPGTVDIGRYQQGHPMMWQVWEDSKRESGRQTRIIVPIRYNLASSCGISSEELFRVGANIVALVDVLESRGVRTEITVADARGEGGRYNNSAYWTCVIKRSQDVVDLDRLAFVLCNPSMSRRLGFYISEVHCPQMTRHNYGIVSSLYVEDAINIDGSYRGIFDHRGLLNEKLVKQLASYGVEM